MHPDYRQTSTEETHEAVWEICLPRVCHYALQESKRPTYLFYFALDIGFLLNWALCYAREDLQGALSFRRVGSTTSALEQLRSAAHLPLLPAELDGLPFLPIEVALVA